MVYMAQDMTAQAAQQGVPMENPPSSTMANGLRDFMRMNLCIYTGSKIDEDLEKYCSEGMFNDSMDIFSLEVHVQQVEKIRNRNHTMVVKK